MDHLKDTKQYIRNEETKQMTIMSKIKSHVGAIADYRLLIGHTLQVRSQIESYGV